MRKLFSEKNGTDKKRSQERRGKKEGQRMDIHLLSPLASGSALSGNGPALPFHRPGRFRGVLVTLQKTKFNLKAR